MIFFFSNDDDGGVFGEVVPYAVEGVPHMNETKVVDDDESGGGRRRWKGRRQRGRMVTNAPRKWRGSAHTTRRRHAMRDACRRGSREATGTVWCAITAVPTKSVADLVSGGKKMAGEDGGGGYGHGRDWRRMTENKCG